MDSNYKCFIDIRFSGGDIQFDVSNDTQLFSFKSGIGFVAIPHFFSTLSSLYKGEISEARLDCHGNFDYYIFSSDGTNLFIEHTSHYPDGIFNYQFKLKEYIEAIDTEFQKYLQQLEKEGILPLKTKEFAHPLGDDVLNSFYEFSSLLNLMGAKMNDNIDKSNIGYTFFKPTGVRHEFPVVNLVKQQVIGTVLYKEKIYMTVVIDLQANTIQVQGDVAELGDLTISRDSYIDMFKGQAKFFIDNNISNPEKYYNDLINNQSS